MPSREPRNRRLARFPWPGGAGATEFVRYRLWDRGRRRCCSAACRIRSPG